MCLWLSGLSFALCAVLLGVAVREVRAVCVRRVWRCVKSGQVCCCLGGREGKYIVTKACVCWLVWLDGREHLNIKCIYRFVGEIRGRFMFLCQELRW